MKYVITILTTWAFLTVAFLVWGVIMTFLYYRERKKDRSLFE